MPDVQPWRAEVRRSIIPPFFPLNREFRDGRLSNLLHIRP
jgi:hypothetical protein